jgi:hypothetical protein
MPPSGLTKNTSMCTDKLLKRGGVDVRFGLQWHRLGTETSVTLIAAACAAAWWLQPNSLRGHVNTLV